ncbi:putative aquaporin [Venustampulla echinocandica]|uniref:Putative aquaporin n=1 Tax=Venustampulla echinocandica TaxID=2656787 RepID=A0A370TER7_9HELO|nr:putative aquaporin [Venustampulla echinocandica]RDL33185.1 putative aquaporin [Venustampulla echinocandica]
MFLFFAYGGVMVGNTALGGKPSTSNEYLVFLLFAATSFGVSLAVNAWIFYRVTGGLFNPAVTMAFVLAGLMHPIRGAVLFVAQLLGGIVAAAIIDALIPGPLNVANSLGPHVNVAQGLFMEMFLTAELILAIFMLAVEKHRATFLAPLGIGSALFIGHIVGIYYTGAGLNPARSLGPCVVERSFPGYHWIYWIGPGLGAMLATAFYKLLLAMKYQEANPDQDIDCPIHLQHSLRSNSIGQVEKGLGSGNTAPRVAPTAVPRSDPRVDPRADPRADPREATRINSDNTMVNG